MSKPELINPFTEWLAKQPLPPNLLASKPPPTDEELQAARDADAARMAQDAVRAFDGQLPRAYRWSSFLDPFLAQRCPFPKQVAAGKDAAEHGRVVLMGPPGSGKTSLAVAMLRHRWELGEGRNTRWFIFAHAYKLGTARIQHAAGDGEADYVGQALAASVLLLDDVGSERHTATNAVPDVIFDRHAEELPTWFTTGLTADQLAERYGGGIARRIFEGATIIRLGK